MSNKESVVICRCEEVTYGQLQTTANEHKCTARELKLRTRAGMGFCGGRTCRLTLDRIIESVIPEVLSSEIPLKYQPPIRPVTFGTVGGNQ
ncbi:(2Fe-2S)-binding protein [Priestia filamentosa]|uniref:Pyridine nucleotide-disulfide oxidoreductase n=1 Tax=Priestia filamentosa TaxID=1402861 RepID=A0A1X7EPW0_9BACI|nr:(2Fe-2S)-binding protein [Priestia filamentosa]AKO93192.1 pyridine nucleotide-disulfide oxidoreductase [Priestia filamentosa]MDT3763332.1 (2Fe-2S)-binding protein [Priestia filamentosa]OXS69892.1 pyridine nucleotide-disulfide oxidoreductase [Priestia filamentosa]RJS63521.1 (2Fe-2S)-binding protein [Priestia filamentosa]WRU93793.1 (2Fe-2S)-binding protein [Priestia filamentosa]